jgi:hypothetical protein
MDLNFALFPPPNRSSEKEKEDGEDKDGVVDWKESLIYIDSPSSEFSPEGHKIPCIFIPGRSKRLLVYFHGNGEDLYSCHDLAVSLEDCLGVNVLVPEYPGYGIYKEMNPNMSPSVEAIERDSANIWKHLT